MGIEPTYHAWEARVLPLNYTRVSGDIADDPGWAGIIVNQGRKKMETVH